MKKTFLTLILVSILTLTACTSTTDKDDKSSVIQTESIAEKTAEITTEATTEAPTEEVKENKIEDVSETEKKLTCYVDEQKVGGFLYLPEGEGPFPTLVFVSGGGADYYQYAEETMKIVENGIAVVSFDCRGGVGVSLLSDGEMSEWTPQGSVKDIMAITNLISEHPAVDTDKLFIIGHSMGGYTAAVAAAENPDVFKGMIGFDPSYWMHDEFNKLQSEGIDVEELKRIGVPPAFFYGVLKINFDEIIKSFTQEVLLLTGIESDTLLSCYPDIVQKYEEAFPNAELVVVEGADHSFSRHKDKLVELVVDFINKNIK